MSYWAQDLKSMEAVSQDELIRSLVLRLAGLARGGRLDCFIAAVGSDEELDGDTKARVLALARDEAVLLAAEDYMRACSYLH